MYNPQDFYFKKAKQAWYKARSAFKLEEINDKFHLINKSTKTVLDVWCSPGSWMQFTYAQLQKLGVKDFTILWFDLKPVEISLPWVFTYIQDITDHVWVSKIFKKHKLEKLDFIQSDMAPNTMGMKDFDAIRSVWLLEQTLRIYKEFLKPDGKFVIKIFMGPGFDAFVLDLKKIYGGKNIKVYKPKACRSESKETYIIKI